MDVQHTRVALFWEVLRLLFASFGNIPRLSRAVLKESGAELQYLVPNSLGGFYEDENRQNFHFQMKRSLSLL